MLQAPPPPGRCWSHTMVWVPLALWASVQVAAAQHPGQVVLSRRHRLRGELLHSHTLRTAGAVLCSLTSLNVSHGTKSSGGSRVCVLMPTSCRSASPRAEAAHCSILAAEVVTIPRPDRHLAAASGGLAEAMMQCIRGTYSLASGTSQHGQ